MRNLFVKGLMAAAAVVTLASCSNDEEAFVQPTGEAHSVAFGVSVAPGVGTKTANAAADVNQVTNGAYAKIENITVVPMVGEVLQAPITIGDLSPAASQMTAYTGATVLNTVNGFRVYANIPVANTTNIQSSGWTYAAAQLKELPDYNDLIAETPEAGWTVVDQFPLLYYKNTTVGDDPGYYAVYNTADWNAVDDWETKQTTALGDDNRVKIDGVGYAVGVLASGVRYQNKEAEETCFNIDGTPKTYAEVVNGGGSMTLTAIAIQNQPAELDINLEETGDEHNALLVAEACNATFQEGPLSFTGESSRVVEGANIYAVVMPEDEESIVISFQFKNESGGVLTLNDGTTQIANGDFVYYSTTLADDDVKQMKIFDAGYTTLLNAVITDWGNGTQLPPKTTDIQVGVEIDVQWAEGLSYNVEI